MTPSNTDISKFLAEKIGVKDWHEPIMATIGKGGPPKCVCGYVSLTFTHHSSHLKLSNPDFFRSAEDLLRLMEWAITLNPVIYIDSDDGAILVPELFPKEFIEKDSSGDYTLPRKIYNSLKEGE